MKSAFYTPYEGKFAFTYALLCNSMNKLSFCSLCSTLISVAAFYHFFPSLPIGVLCQKNWTEQHCSDWNVESREMRETFQFQGRCWNFFVWNRDELLVSIRHSHSTLACIGTWKTRIASVAWKLFWNYGRQSNCSESVIKTNIVVCFPSKDFDLRITRATSIQTVIKSLAPVEAENFCREKRAVPISRQHLANPFLLQIISK